MKLIHRALIYNDADEFLNTAVSFVREGLDLGEVVLAVSPPDTIGILRRELGASADAVEFHDAASWYSQPTRTIAAYASFITDHPAARLRVLTEPAWSCDRPAQVTEWTRYESMVNRAFAEIEGSVLCNYDRRGTAPEIIDGALRTHPELIDAIGPFTNGAYVNPSLVYAEVDRQPLSPSPPDAATLPVESTDLSFLRSLISGHALDHGMSPARLNDLLVATTEVITNAIRHGLPPISCRLWVDHDELVVDVTDAGAWTPEEMSGFLPPAPLAPSGFGLWGVRMLCTLVQLRTGPAGTTVRLHVPLR